MLNNRNPIEHIKTRVKSPEKLLEKLERKGLELTRENTMEHINDIAGVRIVCSFVYEIIVLILSIANLCNKKTSANSLPIFLYISFNSFTSISIFVYTLLFIMATTYEIFCKVIYNQI